MYGQTQQYGQPPQTLLDENGNPVGPQQSIVQQPQGLVPQFPQLAAFVDGYAKQIPWWAWFVGGMALFGYLTKNSRQFRQYASKLGL